MWLLLLLVVLGGRRYLQAAGRQQVGGIHPVLQVHPTAKPLSCRLHFMCTVSGAAGCQVQRLALGNIAGILSSVLPLFFLGSGSRPRRLLTRAKSRSSLTPSWHPRIQLRLQLLLLEPEAHQPCRPSCAQMPQWKPDAVQLTRGALVAMARLLAPTPRDSLHQHDAIGTLANS
ncbi:hypothetical protein CDD81_1917 [Ophiocordyceps australis]|uniref:Secreted protein n=1 Tax=Ophiocordyceps australis TaxID=1399860 RepID=A0A2C5XF22_9HYPO|nr:hypothetical protein CDD81_1917 [Ophiocordyceps australis]